MKHRAYRILVAQLFQETHGFTPVLTPMSAFEFEHGAEMLSANRDADSVLGGMLRVFASNYCEVIPTLAARARPGGRVEEDSYRYIKEVILAGARKRGFDAIALCLHGCTQTESLDSAELDLLSALREVVGNELPIVAGFDLHANAIPQMLRLLTFCSAYKTNPHGDAGDTGERVAKELLRILDGTSTPRAAYVHVPMLTRGNDETTHGPLAILHRQARDSILENVGLIDASLFNVNPFIDGKGVGQSVLVYAQPDSIDQASALARDLAQGLWDARDLFQHALPGLEETLRAHEGGTEKLTLGDFGDRVLAGAPGDSVYLLESVLAHSRKRVVAVVTDPVAYETCVDYGEGADVEISVGGRLSPGCTPMVARGRVSRLGDGVYRNRGKFMRGATMRLGPYAVLESDRYQLLITKEAVMSQDPGCYLDIGIDLDSADVIVTKSGYHFKLAFDVFGPCLCIETPGYSGFHPERLPFSLARPIYPVDPISFAPEVVTWTPPQSPSH